MPTQRLRLIEGSVGDMMKILMRGTAEVVGWS